MTRPDKTQKLTNLIERGSRLAQERRNAELSDEELDAIAGGSGLIREQVNGATIGMVPTKQIRLPEL
jgi:hypothetical protein